MAKSRDGSRGNRTAGEKIDSWHDTFCPYCGVGCGLRVGVHNGKVAKVRGNPDHPSSLGDLCLKPIHLPGALDTPDRIREPLMRMNGSRSGEHAVKGAFHSVTWEKATTYIAASLKRIVRDHGPDAVAFYGSGQFTTEDYYVANKLLKGFIGTNNFDANSRLCMASAVAGYVSSLGSDGPPPAYEDIDHADCFFLIGSNMADCHPVLFNRIKRRKKQDPEMVKVIVVDPRETRTAAIADLFLPLRPGSDVVLLNAMMKILASEGKIDRAFIDRHTNGFEELMEASDPVSTAAAAKVCGISESDLTRAARLFGEAQGVLSFWSMGLNQSVNGVAKNQAVINLHLATGQIGKPGSGPFSLTGQPNAMGGREAGGLSHLLPGYRTVASALHRQEVEKFWRAPAGNIAGRPGLAAVDMFEAAARGDIKAMWIMCTNPVVSMPNIDVVERAMEKLELLIVTDAYHPTDTTQYAHVLLPAAQWSEREGVMTNSERRITYLPRMVDPAGQARPDWRIIADVGAAMGFPQAFSYESSNEVFDEFSQLTRGRVCDYSGVSVSRLKAEGPLQWPVPEADHPGTVRLYSGLHDDQPVKPVEKQGGDGELLHAAKAGAEPEASAPVFATADGSATIHTPAFVPPAELPNRRFPLLLTTGRLRNQWHTMTRTGKSESLLKGARQPFLEIHPVDAVRRQIENGDVVEIRSRRGRVWAEARVTEKIREGACFMPFHWGRLAGPYSAANNVTLAAVDPISKEPELKACAVEVRLRPGYEALRASKPFQRLAKALRR
ncbi:MAG: molybdopterin-dependent oxidoreductase [Caldilineaceae bacterium SB0664_bin_27]|uniref:Molybdopterin-dependent oxidoreductase n=1 Tax=Caldilineaceae bacterium SB0664_bin_27 TaxID=2605260 RepID=A0A6B0YRL2_9CHLR|nr:molybdopterin-dependent oxidoreductase [Caldilineaceae bacterium SB0664_bin_27]